MFWSFGFQESKQEVWGGSPEGKKKEKIMKKSRQIFGAVALSAVLAFGTAVPAFANVVTDIDPTEATDETEYSKENLADGASTNVNIATYSSNYSVIVPLYAPFMLDTAGGTGIAPNNYGIKNHGDAAVFVTNVEWTMNEAGAWTFGYELGSDTTPMNVNLTSIRNNNTSPQNPEYGSFVITLAPDGYDETNAPQENAPVSTFVKQTVGTGTGTSTTNCETTGSKAVKWIINTNDAGDTEDRNNIALSIMGSKLFKSLTETQLNVASIVYTVDSRAPQMDAVTEP